MSKAVYCRTVKLCEIYNRKRVAILWSGSGRLFSNRLQKCSTKTSLQYTAQGKHSLRPSKGKDDDR